MNAYSDFNLSFGSELESVGLQIQDYLHDTFFIVVDEGFLRSIVRLEEVNVLAFSFYLLIADYFFNGFSHIKLLEVLPEFLSFDL